MSLIVNVSCFYVRWIAHISVIFVGDKVSSYRHLKADRVGSMVLHRVLIEEPPW